jgi:hypothetical protein
MNRHRPMMFTRLGMELMPKDRPNIPIKTLASGLGFKMFASPPGWQHCERLLRFHRAAPENEESASK